MTSIGGSAFYECDSLRSVFLPKVESIGVSAFRNCDKLERIVVGDRLSQLGTSSSGDADDINRLYNSNNFNSPNLKEFFIFSERMQLPKNAADKIFNTNSIPVIYVLDKDNSLAHWQYYREYFQSVLSITDYNGTYTGSTPIFNYTNKAPFMNLSFSENVKNVGIYSSIEATYSYEDWSFTHSFPANITITKAPLTVIAESKTRRYGEPNPDLTYQYVGFVADETEEVLSVCPTITTSATQSSKPGSYPIIVTGGSAQNYEFSYTQGTLTIEKALQTISWSQDLDSIHIGAEIELTAEATSGETITYSSSDESIARIIVRGGKHFLQAQKVGNVSISAVQAGSDCFEPSEYLEKKIEITPIKVESVSLNYTKMSINIGSTTTLTATVLPLDATNPEIIWTSSDESVAIVENGVVTAVGVGNTTIAATSTDGTNISGTCIVTVNPILATDLTLSDVSLTIPAGSINYIIASITPSNATCKDLLWTSSDEEVASVEDGLVTAKKKGVCVITVSTTDGSELKAMCKVTVTASALSTFQLNKSETSLFPGEAETLVASIDGVNTSEVVWHSLNENVATVSNGTVTAVGVGETYVVATTTDGSNLSAQCRVTVNPILSTSISLNMSEVDVKKGTLVQLTAEIYPENTTNKSVVWSSSDENVAIVNGNGLVTTIESGTTIVSATSANNPSVSATCIIRVSSEEDAIEEILQINSTTRAIYTLDGRRVTEMKKGRLYIVNGKKMYVK